MLFEKSIIVKNYSAKTLCNAQKCEEVACVVCVTIIIIVPFHFFCVAALSCEFYFHSVRFRLHVFFCVLFYYLVSFFLVVTDIIDIVIVIATLVLFPLYIGLSVSA